MVKRFIVGLRPDHFIYYGIILSLLFRKSRDFIKDWVPFLVLWMSYDMMRGIADNLSDVHVREIYDLELKLFGWMFNDQIPAFWAQQHKNIYFDLIGAWFYTLHGLMPIVIAGLFYYVEDDKELFKEFTISFLILTYMALITFVLYPVAPPWYVLYYGFRQPQQRSGLSESAAGLVSIDEFFSNDFYGTFYQTFNSNSFAALPSLHSGFAVICTYFFIKKYQSKTKLVYLSILYPIGMWMSAVYLNHHYIVDLLLGAIYVVIAINLKNLIFKTKTRIFESDTTEEQKVSRNQDEAIKQEGEKVSHKQDETIQQEERIYKKSL